MTTNELLKYSGKIVRADKIRTKVDEALKTVDLDLVLWNITSQENVIPSHAVITDPPYGILDESWAELFQIRFMGFMD